MLTDKFGRHHNYLRISLTDNCNLRCLYCMPDELIEVMPRENLMQTNEIFDIARQFVELGVCKIRLTGGEPLVRKDFCDIIKLLSTLPVELTITTNAILLDKYICAIRESGVRSINVSLDTMRPDVFKSLTKRNYFDRVWNNILLCVDNDFKVKINVVLIKGLNEESILDFSAVTEKLPINIRFIEFMPFEGNVWDKSKVIDMENILMQ